MKTPSIKTLIRAGYRNRYGLRVTVDKRGEMLGHHETTPGALSVAPTKLGNIADCRSADAGEPGRRTGIRVYNRDFLVFTFGPNGEGITNWEKVPA